MRRRNLIMKKIITLLILALLVSQQVKAECPVKNNGIITAKGNASAEVKPDVANITIAVQTQSKTLVEAVNDNNALAEKINSNLKKIIGKDDQLKTTGYQVFPVYSYDKQSTPSSKLTGYKVTNQIQVKTKTISKIGQIIETALNNGANSVSGLNYSISSTQSICNSLIAQAVKNARLEADTLAAALGMKITGVSKVSSSCSDMQIQPYMMKSFAVADSAGAPPLEAGETTVSTEVYVEYIIE